MNVIHELVLGQGKTGGHIVQRVKTNGLNVLDFHSVSCLGDRKRPGEGRQVGRYEYGRLFNRFCLIKNKTLMSMQCFATPRKVNSMFSSAVYHNQSLHYQGRRDGSRRVIR